MTALSSACAWRSDSASRPVGKSRILTPNGNATAFGTMPRIKTYKIVGLFDLGMYQYDNNMILMPLAAAQLFFNTRRRR